ncbi:hypothetical protein ASPWEDRAFT_27209 [Aspergillus wentii DTO 134E9]|uniref:Uncharacterized protein n=1 Tax=Aspergillus wentii DTO 134E9 TaxID=1073089 RepID=A0A1L9RSP6_ASPWE|nr:uncharacterized protein ASPWEDRAFT_27209 [Aspergillus wentii DTO 134E9]OJJ37868.1 hypothetical protein ASPWEDRAFT_27209 [Aspergillus wentii DTO 134E9]
MTVHVWLGVVDFDDSGAFRVLNDADDQGSGVEENRRSGITVIPQLYIHDKGLELLFFIRGVNVLVDPSVGDGTLSSTVRNAVNLVRTIRQPPRPLFELLWDFHRAECLDLRDRLFSLYGLVCNRNRDMHVLPEVDYSQHWTHTYQLAAVTVLMRGACMIVEHLDNFLEIAIEGHQMINLFNQVHGFGSLSDLDHSLPFWVPNWPHSRLDIQNPSNNMVPKTSNPGCRFKWLNPNKYSILEEGHYGIQVPWNRNHISPIKCVSNLWPIDQSLYGARILKRD